MMEQDILKILSDIQKNNYDIKGYDVKKVIDETLPFIGHHDPKVRDDLVYPVLAHLFHDHHLSETDFEHYLDLLISDDYLCYDLENKESYSVLKRSFTVLQLVIVCFVHRRDHIINEDKINQLLKRFLDYYKKESILTGYDPQVGWIHTIAHSADLFSQLVQVEHYKEKDILDIFEVIQDKMMNDHHDFICSEDERSVVAIKKALDLNRINQEHVLSWLDGFIIKDKDMIYPNKMILENSIKRFLRSLYFSIYKDEKNQEVTKHIEFILTENQKR
jgi:hypothetical protein